EVALLKIREHAQRLEARGLRVPRRPGHVGLVLLEGPPRPRPLAWGEALHHEVLEGEPRGAGHERARENAMVRAERRLVVIEAAARTALQLVEHAVGQSLVAPLGLATNPRHQAALVGGRP